MVEIIEGESLIEHTSEFDIILIGTNCYQVMRNGIQYEIAHKFPYVQEANDKTKYADVSKVGTYIECNQEGNPLIILGFISFGYNFKGNDKEFIDYDGLVNILKFLNIIHKGKTMATTMIGCTPFDGNGDKQKVLGLFNKYLKDINLTIFDYNQETCKRIQKKEYLKSIKSNDKKTNFNR